VWVDESQTEPGGTGNVGQTMSMANNERCSRLKVGRGERPHTAHTPYRIRVYILYSIHFVICYQHHVHNNNCCSHSSEGSGAASTDQGTGLGILEAMASGN
jgi:hypothetical protein